MLIKTSEPNRQIELMLRKRDRRRRLARRQYPNRDALQAATAAMSMSTQKTQASPVPSRVLHHAKPHAAPIRQGQNVAAGRISRDLHAVTRWNVFRDVFL
jgi:hypothetical protein